jgi:molybdopterin-guanine dinucleotide biosynthesis protein A
MKKRAKQAVCFAVCINNKRYEASLEAGKLYRVIPDEEAESHGYLRVVDEGGDDYGYSADRFFASKCPVPWSERC